jgi:hypothetical protein
MLTIVLLAAVGIISVWPLLMSTDYDEGPTSTSASRRSAHASSSSSSSSSSSFPGYADGDPALIHAYTCVTAQDWRLVLLDRESPHYLGRAVRQLAAPIDRLTLIIGDGMRGESAPVERAFVRVCKALVRRGNVTGGCQAARIPTEGGGALGHYGLEPEDFGKAGQFRRSACPLVATFLEAKGGTGMYLAGRPGVGDPRPGSPTGPPTLFVYFESDVSLVRPSSWLTTAAAFTGYYPTRHIVSVPCWDAADPSVCETELDTSQDAIENTLSLPMEWTPLAQPSFSQKIFALPSATLRKINWKQAEIFPDGGCSGFADVMSYEHRACRWLVLEGWKRALHRDAAVMRTGFEDQAMKELSTVLEL